MVAASSLYGGAIIVPTTYEYKVIYIEITAPCRWIGNYHRRFAKNL